MTSRPRSKKPKPKPNPIGIKPKELNNQAAALENQVRDLRNSIKGVKEPGQRKQVEDQIDALKKEAEALRLQARDAQAAGDRLYWPIYNLDIKNPNTPEEESHDPDVLLEKYKKLLADIEETQNQLKSELAAALAHHFERRGPDGCSNSSWPSSGISRRHSRV